MNPSEYRAGLSMILSMIKVPTEDGTFTMIVNPKDIEERLLEQNWQHYGQADQTEMASEQMREVMGPSGTSNFCDKVLEGNADLLAMSSSLQAIFQQLSNPPDVQISESISYDDYKDALKCWKEKTSTSPSGDRRRYGRTRRGDAQTPSQNAINRSIPSQAIRMLEKRNRSYAGERSQRPKN
jgi:hypothetical protein